MERPRLCKLIAVVGHVLERNVSLDVAVNFKNVSTRFAVRTHEILVRVVPALELRETQLLFEIMFALIAGMWPMAHPPPVLQEAIAIVDPDRRCIDLEERVTLVLERLVEPYMARGE